MNRPTIKEHPRYKDFITITQVNDTCGTTVDEVQIKKSEAAEFANKIIELAKQ